MSARLPEVRPRELERVVLRLGYRLARSRGSHHIYKPTFPICHPNSWNSYHFPTAKGTVSPMQPSDGMILVIGPRLEGHSVIFLAIQTHLSCRFLLAVDSLGLRRSGSSSQIINQAQDFPEQVPRHRHLSQLERNVAAMSDCQWRSKKGPPRRCKKGPLGGCGLVPVVHGRAPRATRRALNRLTRRRAREGPVGPRGQAWAGWSVQLAVGV